MKGNFHVRFLEEGEGAISPSYSAIGRIFTDNFNPWVSVSSVKSVFYRVSAFICVHLRLINRGAPEALVG